MDFAPSLQIVMHFCVQSIFILAYLQGMCFASTDHWLICQWILKATKCAQTAVSVELSNCKDAKQLFFISFLWLKVRQSSYYFWCYVVLSERVIILCFFTACMTNIISAKIFSEIVWGFLALAARQLVSNAFSFRLDVCPIGIFWF